MEILHPRCCGLDVHKKSVVACLRLVGPGTKVHSEVRTFSAMTDDLLALADWLRGHEVTHVAMESSGVYWKPVYNLLEGDFQLILVNAAQIKNLPGRKTDVQDAEWIADLLAHGLLRGSYVPDQETREGRELVRYRKSLVRQRTAEVNRLHKVLEGANIKLGSVVTDITGQSGRAILSKLLAGEEEPQLLASLARGKLRHKQEELAKALHGRMGPHQRFMLQQLLAHIDYLDQTITHLEREIEARLLPFEDMLRRLTTAPGIKRCHGQTIAVALPDLKQFPSARHLASWAGLCPGNNESANKRKRGKMGKGNAMLREALVEAAWAAVRKKDTYLSVAYRRLAARRGPKRAIVAVAHSLLISIYYMLTRGLDYQDLGPSYFDRRKRSQVKHHLVRRLEAIGYLVTVQPLVTPV